MGERESGGTGTPTHPAQRAPAHSPTHILPELLARLNEAMLRPTEGGEEGGDEDAGPPDDLS